MQGGAQRPRRAVRHEIYVQRIRRERIGFGKGVVRRGQARDQGQGDRRVMGDPIGCDRPLLSLCAQPRLGEQQAALDIRL